MLTVGSLFAGIGGIDLGLESTGGFKTRWFCEIDLFCRETLAHHWPDLPIYGDITKQDWSEVEPVDMLCGGFPCQDVSTAGKGAGIEEGTRSGLWFEFRRAIRALRPGLILVENVTGILVRGRLGIVLGCLAEDGYDAEWTVLSACQFGAPHARERVFIVAHPANDGSQGHLREARPQTIFNIPPKALAPWNLNGSPFIHWEKLMAQPGTLRMADGVPSTLDVRPRLRAYGNAVVPQITAYIGHCILEALR